MSREKPEGPDRPWIMRTYAGHTDASASNALFRRNLDRGQSGLSIAFDLPTQTGYDADDALARGEVGKVGVPVSHLGDMRTLFHRIPIERMNTSMTINATAPWLLALYLALAEERRVDFAQLAGTTQNDVIKEYLSRGTYIFPPAASMQLSADLIAYTVEHVPRWNPINICSYHLQEAGATPVQELAYAMVTAIGVIDAVRAAGRVPEAELGRVIGRTSFFVNAGIRFVDEMCKMRAFVELWDSICQERYGVEDPKLRRFRYGVQVNSLGLTEQQPENNIIRIVIEMLAVTLSRDARARAVQLPAWNEALGLPRPWDQQWSLRAQQILAYETDLLEHADLFEGSHMVAARVRDLVTEARAEIEDVLGQGGAIEAVESGYIKQRLVESNAARLRAIERGDKVVVGVNRWVEGEPSPLVENLEDAVLVVDPAAERSRVQSLARWRAERDGKAVKAALADLKKAVASSRDVIPASIAAAHAGVTTGEWAGVLRKVLGEYRAPTGVAGAAVTLPSVGGGGDVDQLRKDVAALTETLGRRPRLLVGKPGLDGHSNGAEQVALKARDVGFDVVYEGIRSTPAQIVASALEEGVHLVGLSVLSGSHLVLVPEIMDGLREAGLAHVPVVVGGIIPESDTEALERAGVARIYTPKDYALDAIMANLISLVSGAVVHAE